MAYDPKIKEEELKNKVAADVFGDFDCTRILAGRALYRYYHSRPGALPDASFYDIRARFQGFKPNGHMNPDSDDAEYTRLLGDLRAAMKALAARIAPKVREHGFLR